MSLVSNFDVLLREYAPNDLLINEVTRVNWLLKKLKKDTQWPLGQYQIPLETNEASRFEWGALPAAADIPLAGYAKPYVSAPKQLLGSMLFDQVDLERHTGDMRKSFLSIIPQKINQFIERMSETINMSLLSDGSICALTANGTAGGLVTVGKARVTLFTERQKVQLKGTGAAVLTTGYVRNIDVNAGTFLLYSAPTGGAVVDVSLQTTTLASKVYVVGATVERATSLVDIIFSAANGGQDTLYNGSLVKSASAVFQPYFSDVSSATTGATFIQALYDTLYECEEMGRGGIQREVILPYNAYKAVAKAAEANRKYEMGKEDVIYGSSSVMLTGPHGAMTLRAARALPQDKCFFIDYSALTIASRGDLIKKANPMSDDECFEVRNTTGYQYICDKKAEFELVVTNPQKLGGLKISPVIT
jgi:hypothetical protein